MLFDCKYMSLKWVVKSDNTFSGNWVFISKFQLYISLQKMNSNTNKENLKTHNLARHTAANLVIAEAAI